MGVIRVLPTIKRNQREYINRTQSVRRCSSSDLNTFVKVMVCGEKRMGEYGVWESYKSLTLTLCYITSQLFRIYNKRKTSNLNNITCEKKLQIKFVAHQIRAYFLNFKILIYSP